MDYGLRTIQDFSYSFDPVGNVSSIQGIVASAGGGTHSANQSFDYDELNRLTYASGPYGTRTYDYDPIGNMTEKSGILMSYGLADGSKPHAVTSVGSGLGAGGSGLSLNYDANGNLISKSPTASSLEPTAQSFTYDAENRLVEVKSAAEETASVTFQPGWNFFSLPVIPDDSSVEAVFPNFSQDFEQIVRIASAQSPEPGARSEFEHYVGHSKFDDFSELEYGIGYQIYCKSSSSVTVPFTGLLPTSRRAYELDAGWHLLPTLSLEPSALSEVFKDIDYEDVRAYDYDKNDGSLITVAKVDPAQAYWVKVRTSSVWRPSLPRDPTTKFFYDGDGGKVKRVNSDGTTIFLGEVYEKAPDGTATKYVFAGNQRIAAVTQSPEPIAQSPFGFTGQRQDETNGLVLFPARAYDPELGRFLQPDPFVQNPADPQTLNRYSYVRNNPVKYVDPSGYFSFKKLWAAIGLALVAVVAFVVGVGLALTGNEPGAAAAFKVSFWAATASATMFVAAFQDSASPRGPPGIQTRTGRSDTSLLGSPQAGTPSNFGPQPLELANSSREAAAGANLQDAAAFLVSDMGVSERASLHVAEGFRPSPTALRLIEGLGWLALGIAISQLDSPFLPFLDIPGAAVAARGLLILHTAGTGLALAGGLQVSYAVTNTEGYPGQTQGKITRELNKA